MFFHCQFHVFVSIGTRVSYYLKVSHVEPHGRYFIYYGFTARVLKVCRAPGLTAYIKYL